MRAVLLSASCWPNLHYFFHLLRHEEIVIEQHDTYGKQSYRNRFEILSANGPLMLTVPVSRNNRSTTREVRISYTQRWQHQHWGAIESAYGKAPYFEHFEEEIKNAVFVQQEFLLEYNLNVLRAVSKLIRRPLNLSLSTGYEKDPETLDLREITNSKKDFNSDPLAAPILNAPYYQTFGDRFGFVPNLSILDLLFNAGPESLDYLSAGHRLRR